MKAVLFVDSLTSIRLWYYGFSYHSPPFLQSFSAFPFRPHNLLARNRSPSSHLTYWYRPHRSTTKLPIVFIHGIGIGLYPYVDFLFEINADSGLQVGIIAVEVMPISFRIAPTILQKDEMCVEINRILRSHGWEKFVLVSHSYGSVITTHMLHHPDTAPSIGSVLFVDPVTFLLHLPDVAFNFVGFPHTSGQISAYQDRPPASPRAPTSTNSTTSLPRTWVSRTLFPVASSGARTSYGKKILAAETLRLSSRGRI